MLVNPDDPDDDDWSLCQSFPEEVWPLMKVLCSRLTAQHF